MRKEGNIDEAAEAMDYEDMEQQLPGGEATEERASQDADTDYGEPTEYTDDEPEPVRPTLKEVIEENAREDEKPFSSSQALRTILGGDILNTQAIRKQVWLILIITVFAILYISNRYSCQQQQIKIDNLNTTLKKSRYKTLSLSSELTERCRESHVLQMLRANNDSIIQPADQPPYIIVVPN
ncbi:MAG: hypothetical protein J5529_13370 [Prevotella sp.]|nr:hypothetical protein [Prevotella sp.]